MKNKFELDEIQTKWLEIMRDPNTKQSRGSLVDKDGGLCVYGTGCVAMGMKPDLSGKPKLVWGSRTFTKDVSSRFVARHFGIGLAASYELAKMNDSDGYTLPQLANVIENYLTNGFVLLRPVNPFKKVYDELRLKGVIKRRPVNGV